jgi:hypothetical protein
MNPIKWFIFCGFLVDFINKRNIAGKIQAREASKELQ